MAARNGRIILLLTNYRRNHYVLEVEDTKNRFDGISFIVKVSDKEESAINKHLYTLLV